MYSKITRSRFLVTQVTKQGWDKNKNEMQGGKGFFAFVIPSYDQLTSLKPILSILHLSNWSRIIHVPSPIRLKAPLNGVQSHL